MNNDVRYGGLGVRFLALLVDLLLFCAFFFPITRLVKGVWLMAPTDHRWTDGLFIFDPICLVFLIIMIGYYVGLESWLGLTFGKWVMGLRVVSLDGGKPGLRRGLLRNALRFVDSLPAFHLLGVILILQSPEHARFGDRVAGTRVIHVRERASRQIPAHA